MNTYAVSWEIVWQMCSEMDKTRIMADFADGDLSRMAMMAKGLSLESIGVQQLNPPETSTGQKHDVDDWVSTDISSCCMGQHPPSSRLLHCCTAARAEILWARLR